MKLRIDKFDKRKVTKILAKEGERAVRTRAAYTRRVMINSMKMSKKGKASAPGTPPHSHRSGNGAFRKQILFNVDERGMDTSAVVGPQSRGWAYEIGSLLDKGGVINRVIKKRKRIRIYERVRDSKGRFLPMKGKRKRYRTITWAQRAVYPKRPFTKPALKKTQQRFQ